MKSKTFSGRSLRSSLKGSTWILVLLLLGVYGCISGSRTDADWKSDG